MKRKASLSNLEDVEQGTLAPSPKGYFLQTTIKIILHAFFFVFELYHIFYFEFKKLKIDKSSPTTESPSSPKKAKKSYKNRHALDMH